MIIYYHCGWYSGTNNEPIFNVSANPRIPLCFTQSQELDWKSAFEFVHAIVEQKHCDIDKYANLGPIMISGKKVSPPRMGYHCLVDDHHFHLNVPELGILALAQAVAKSLDDWLTISGIQLPEIKNELRVVLEKVHERVLSLGYQGATVLGNSKYKNTKFAEVRDIVNMVQYNSNWLPEIEEEELFRNMWVSVANVMRGGNSINRVNIESLKEETDRTVIADYLRVKGIWGTRIPASFYEINYNNPTDKLDVYLVHYHELLEFSAQFNGGKLGTKVLDRVAADWFYRVNGNLPDGVDLYSFTEACLNCIADTLPQSAQRIELDLLGWRVRLHLDWVTLGNIGLVDADFVYDLAEDDPDWE